MYWRSRYAVSETISYIRCLKKKKKKMLIIEIFRAINWQFVFLEIFKGQRSQINTEDELLRLHKQIRKHFKGFKRD